MKNRARSADIPGLITGLAYFVADSPYQAYLSMCPAQTEVSHVMNAQTDDDILLPLDVNLLRTISGRSCQYPQVRRASIYWCGCTCLRASWLLPALRHW